MTLRMGWFSSGQDEMSAELLRTVIHKQRQGFLDISISFAFFAWEEGDPQTSEASVARRRMLELARGSDIPVLRLSAHKVRAQYMSEPGRDWRACFGRQLRKTVYERPFELGFMDRMEVDEDTCTRFDLMGLYPSLPDGPRGDEAEVLMQVLASKAKTHGMMARACVGRRDTVVPLTFCEFPLDAPATRTMRQELEALARGRPLSQVPQEELRATALFRHILAAQRSRWPPFLTYTIKLFADGDLDIVNGRPVANGLSLAAPIDLTRAVDRALEQP
jgi:hypothetical protein